VAANVHPSGSRARFARIGLRIRLAVAIGGISALVSVISGLVVYQRVSVDRYDQARVGYKLARSLP
jgi:hypothetical protein